LGAGRAAARDGLKRALRILRARAGRCESVADADRRDPQGGDGATWIAFKGLAERLLAGDEGEGMKQCDAALETFLRLRRAGIGEGDGSKLFRRRRFVIGTRERRRCEQREQQKTREGAAG